MPKTNILGTIFGLFVIFIVSLELWGEAIVEFIRTLFWSIFIVIVIFAAIFFFFWLRNNDYL
tara:strand:+ start:324 stop:509 length:186 start_codon:yes stop_codon:yes gene_type:complete